MRARLVWFGVVFGVRRESNAGVDWWLVWIWSWCGEENDVRHKVVGLDRRDLRRSDPSKIIGKRR